MYIPAPLGVCITRYTVFTDISDNDAENMHACMHISLDLAVIIPKPHANDMHVRM